MQDIKKIRLIIVGIAFFVFAAIWVVVTPPFQNADEQAHFAYIQYTGENNELPNPDKLKKPTKYNNYIESVIEIMGTNKIILNNLNAYDSKSIKEIKEKINAIGARKIAVNDFPASEYPPLYYAINLPVYWIFNSSDNSFVKQIYAMRFVSVIMAFFTIYFTYLLGKLFFSNDLYAWAAACIVAFCPAFIHVSTSINNDNLLILIFTAGLYYLLKEVIKSDKNLSIKFYLLVTLFGIAAGLTKPQGWFFLFMIAMILVVRWLIRERFFKNFERRAMLCLIGFGSLLTVCVPYFITFFNKSGTDWLNVNYLMQHHLTLVKKLVKGFVGQFNWGETALSVNYYYTAAILVIIALGFFIRNFIKKYDFNKKWLYLFFATISFALFIFLIDFYYLLKGNTFGLGVQARYLFPVIGCFSIVIINGIRQISSNKIYRKLLPYIIIYLMILFNFTVLIQYYIPRFYA